MTKRTVRGLLVILSLVLSDSARAQWPQQIPPQQPVDTGPIPGTDQAGLKPGIDSSAFVVRSPTLTTEGTRKFLGEIALQIQLLFGYLPTNVSDQVRASTIPGLTEIHSFGRTRNGQPRVLEIAALRESGGYDIYIFGEEGAGERHPNPDLTQLVTEVRALAESERMRTRVTLGEEIYQLDYIQSDRALAGLKALGYATVEYQNSDAEIYDRVYKPIESGEKTRLPVIVKLIDAPKTSLMDSAPPRSSAMGPQGFPQQQMPSYGGQSSTSASAVPDIGGTYLHQTTSGEPQERLLIIYDTADPDALARLVNVLHDKIDTPARQMVIEALVIEINTDRISDLGLQYFASNGKNTAALASEQQSGSTPLTISMATSPQELMRQFGLNLRALVEQGQAQILSNPSVLVLDDRQARIQVGQQVPVVKSTTTLSGVISSVDYFPVGIVLNLRPRTAENGQNVTMQVETIVSAVHQNETSGSSSAPNVLVAPIVDNRQVQTFVRVADNTPFIIGGLISNTRQRQRSGIPLLSEIPLLGYLFGHTSYQDVKKEVIVVITPHVVPLNDPSFSYVIPKDADVFSSFGHQLFRNAYRVRNNDVFDLKFVSDSEAVQKIAARVQRVVKASPSLGTQEPYKSLLKGGVPGEEILVRRMLWEIILKTKFVDNIDTDRIIFFEEASDLSDALAYKPEQLKQRLAQLSATTNTLDLEFDARQVVTSDHPFAQSRARVVSSQVAPTDWYSYLQSKNARATDGLPNHWTIPLADFAVGSHQPIDVLRGALVLKRILSLNRSLPLTLRDFKAGRLVLFPSESDLRQSYWVIDRDVAQYFYEALLYYPAFEAEFKARQVVIEKKLDALETKSAAP